MHLGSFKFNLVLHLAVLLMIFVLEKLMMVKIW